MIPQILIPFKTVVTPLSKQTLKVSPYKISDEKGLLSALEAKNLKDRITTIVSLFKICISDIDLNKIYLGELYWLYLQIYSLSVSEKISLAIEHKNEKEDKPCKVEFDMYINDIKFDEKCEIQKYIELNTTDGAYLLELHYPLISDILKINIEDEKELITCYIGDMTKKDGTKVETLENTEKLQLIDSLPIQKGREIIEFVNNMSMPYYDLETTCNTCGYIVKEKITDFFI